MNIQQNSNINFQATKLLNVQREIKDKAPDVIDVFRLNKGEDDKFIRTCCRVIEQNKSKATTNAKQLKAFFEQFLNESRSNGNEYIIAIKNKKQIAGGCAFYPSINKIVLNKTFVTDKKEQVVKHSLLYSLLARAKNKIDIITGIDLPKLTGQDAYIIQADKVNSTRTQIIMQNPNTTFTTKNKQLNLSQLFDYNTLKQ